METSPPTPTSNTFIFLNHGETEQPDARKQVRSRAAQFSHRVGPRKPKASKKSRQQAAAASRQSSSTKSETSDAQSPLTSRRPSSSTISTAPSSRRNSIKPDGDDRYQHTLAHIPSPARLGSYADEPFDAYPVPAQPWFPHIMQHMWAFMLRGWAALPSTPAEQRVALTWVQRLTVAEPTYFLMNMLSVAGDLAHRGQLHASIVLWLNAQVVAALNAALRDPAAALRAAPILTVGRIALREIVLGDRHTGQAVHRPAFARMIKIAGGLQALGLPPLVRLHVAWAERVMLRKTGVSILDLEPALSAEPDFMEPPWRVSEDKQVLDKYLPMRPPKPDGL